MEGAFAPIISDPADIAAVVDLARLPTSVIGFTNGCFDLFHSGHVAFLAAARTECDFLVVSTPSDYVIRNLKGSDRPIYSVAERSAMLSSNRSVDLVTPYDDDLPAGILVAVQPDVIFKGDEYTGATVYGADAVQARGGRVAFIPRGSRSTTSTIFQCRELSIEG